MRFTFVMLPSTRTALAWRKPLRRELELRRCCWSPAKNTALPAQVSAQAVAAAALADAAAADALTPGGVGALKEALASDKVPALES